MLKPIISADQITFLDQRFYHSEGSFVPSVTTILEAYPKSAQYFKWIKEVGQDADAIRNAAGDRGSNVHKMTEDYDNGLEVSLLNKEATQQWSLQEWGMFEKYVQFRNRFPIAFDAIEVQLIDFDLGFAGTIDRVAKFNGKNYILDVKTANSIYPSYWLQLAAYRQLWEKKIGPIDGVGIIWLNAKTLTDGKKDQIQGKGWQVLLQEDTDKALKLFEHTRALWQEENEDAVPKNISYNLKYKKA